MVKNGDQWNADKGEAELIVAEARNIVQAAGRSWATNPKAENLTNLRVDPIVDKAKDPVGPGGYYQSRAPNKGLDHIECYYQGKYTYVREGQPVITEFNGDVHVSDELPVLKDQPLLLGVDFGANTLNPAAVWAQRSSRGQWLIHAETVGDDIGLDNFSRDMKFTQQDDLLGMELSQGWGDPAGMTRDGLFETTAFAHLLSKGFAVLPAQNNAPKSRIDAWKAVCNRMVDGQPGLLIHPRCEKLIKALSGAWYYKRLPGGRQQEQPFKNHPYSDVADAGGYLLMGGGEYRVATTTTTAEESTRVAPGGSYDADTDFDVFSN